MTYRRKWSKAGVLIVSYILAAIVINAFFDTPNVLHGGAAKMIAAFFLMVIFKVVIEFFLTRWQKARDQKREEKSAIQ